MSINKKQIVILAIITLLLQGCSKFATLPKSLEEDVPIMGEIAEDKEISLDNNAIENNNVDNNSNDNNSIDNNSMENNTKDNNNAENNTSNNTNGEDETMNKWSTPLNFATKDDDVTYGTLERVTYDSTTTNTTRNCYVLTPPNYDNTKQYPVLYLLHGIGGTEEEWLYGSPAYIIGNLINAGEATEMITVIPNVRAAAEDGVPSNLFGAENIAAFDNFINDLHNDLMPYIEANYSISTDREDTAIAGLSMGGRESLFIGFKMLERFAYVGAFSPAPGLLPNSSLGMIGQLKEDELAIPDDKMVPKLILICNGESDGVVNSIPNYYHEVLTKNGVEHIFYTIPGGHDFDVWKNGLYHFVKNIFKAE